MELLAAKPETATFSVDDVTFTFRTKVTVGDRFEINNAGRLERDGKVTIAPLELHRVLVRLFVLSWTGVTANGQPVPYSFDTLTTRLPEKVGEDIIINLGNEIGRATGVFTEKEKEAAAKNG